MVRVTQAVSAGPPVIFLMGPTAAGKTDAAVYLAQHLPCELVSVDSAMVYRGMDVGTAKPDAATLARAPHHLIDICDPIDNYSAGRFHQEVLPLIAAIHARGHLPVLVGGTMLYFNILEKGIAVLPQADAQLRRQLETEASEQGWAAMHQRLQQVDAAAAAHIHPNDPQRIQRALEVYLLTGKPLSQWQRDQRDQDVCPFRLVKIALAPAQRSVLRERIGQRFAAMLDGGLIEELRLLRQRWPLHADLPAMRCVGYRQAWDYLEGVYDRPALLEKGTIATRQLAKRQITWLRSMRDVHWLDSTQSKLLSQLKELIEKAGVVA